MFYILASITLVLCPDLYNECWFYALAYTMSIGCMSWPVACIMSWFYVPACMTQSSSIWERIVAYKAVVVEPRGKDAFTEVTAVS